MFKKKNVYVLKLKRVIMHFLKPAKPVSQVNNMSNASPQVSLFVFQ